MRTVSISVTEASRNFADCVNRVRYQGATFVLQKNGVPVARIVPIERYATNESTFKPVDREAALEPKPARERNDGTRGSEIW